MTNDELLEKMKKMYPLVIMEDIELLKELGKR